MRVAIVAPGMMGAAVGRRLAENGVEVLTSLAGRSPETRRRAEEAGMRDVPEAALAEVDLFLSILPPAEAGPLASRMADLLASAGGATYVDCNAISPQSAIAIGQTLARTGLAYVDAGIIGAPPRAGYDGPVFYASGPHAEKLAALGARGLNIRVLAKPVGAASALKMCYGGITKGITAIAAAAMLGAKRADLGAELRRELAASQPALSAWFERQIPSMYAKAYRWVAEMEEVSAFLPEPAAHDIFAAIAALYQSIADDQATAGEKIRALDDVLSKT